MDPAHIRKKIIAKPKEKRKSHRVGLAIRVMESSILTRADQMMQGNVDVVIQKATTAVVPLDFKRIQEVIIFVTANSPAEAANASSHQNLLMYSRNQTRNTVNAIATTCATVVAPFICPNDNAILAENMVKFLNNKH